MLGGEYMRCPRCDSTSLIQGWEWDCSSQPDITLTCISCGWGIRGATFTVFHAVCEIEMEKVLTQS